MYKKSYIVYQLTLWDIEIEYLKQICGNALKSDKYMIQFTAVQILEKIYEFEEYCILTIPEGMITRFLEMVEYGCSDGVHLELYEKFDDILGVN